MARNKVYQCTYHCTAGSSNKFYTVEMIQEDKGPQPWIVNTTWGKIGKPPQGTQEFTFRTRFDAERLIKEKVNEKTNKKDYLKVRGSEIIGAEKSAAAPKPAVKVFDPFDL
jgi:predicted DNA-binding WGR domain protein